MIASHKSIYITSYDVLISKFDIPKDETYLFCDFLDDLTPEYLILVTEIHLLPEEAAQHTPATIEATDSERTESEAFT